MSEFQYVFFKAIDQPVSAKNLEYMERQSSRAEITAWEFSNDYHYSNFRGNAEEMLRRGYDFHVHYANFGIRKLMIRIPGGFDSKIFSPYFGNDSLKFVKDTKGTGGILCAQPFHDSGSVDEIYDIEDFVDQLLPLRGEILDGDLRPLYLLHLATGRDDYCDPSETNEGPVPAGLEKLTDAQQALAQFCSIDDSLISAAAKGAPKLAKREDSGLSIAKWLSKQTSKNKDEWLVRFVTEPDSAVKREIRTEFRKAAGVTAWPIISLGRSLAELETKAAELEKVAEAKSRQRAAAKKAKLLAAMAADPDSALRETEKLVTVRSSDSYRQIAEILSNLRETLDGSEQSGLAEQQARKLRIENPKRAGFVAALKQAGFLKK